MTLVLTQICAEVWTHTSLKRCGSKSFGQRKLDIRFRYTTASTTAAAATAMTKNVTTAATHGTPGSAEQSDISLFVTLLHCCRSIAIWMKHTNLISGWTYFWWCVHRLVCWARLAWGSSGRWCGPGRSTRSSAPVYPEQTGSAVSWCGWLPVGGDRGEVRCAAATGNHGDHRWDERGDCDPSPLNIWETSDGFWFLTIFSKVFWLFSWNSDYKLKFLHFFLEFFQLISQNFNFFSEF